MEQRYEEVPESLTGKAESSPKGSASSGDSRDGDSAANLLSKSAAYSVAMYIAKFADAIGGLLVAKFLGPTLYGLRNAFGLAIRYEAMTEFGTYVAVNRMAPYHRGRGETGREAEMRDSVFGVNIVYAAIAACVFVSASIFLSNSGVEQNYVDLCLFFGVIVLTGRLLRYLYNELRIDKRMYSLSHVTVLRAVLTAVAGPVMAYMFGLRGLLIALVLADVLSIAYLVLYKKVIPSVRQFKLSALRHVLRIGLPMMMVLTLGLLLRSSDRLVVIFVLSATALGYYGFAVMAVTIVTIIPTVIHDVTLAPIMEEYGASQDRGKVSKYLVGPTILMAYLLPLMVVVLYFAIELPIAFFFAEYLESVVAIKILILSAYLQAIATPSSSIMFVLNRQIQIIGLVFPLVILSLGLNYWILIAGFGINGVAAGVSFVFLVYFVVMTFAASRQFGASTSDYLRFLGKVIAPVGYAIFLILVLEYLMVDVENMLLRSVLQITGFVAAYVWIIVPVRNHFAFVLLFRWVRSHVLRYVT